MASKFNRFGLSRTIPPDVKREVRRRCGFGCIICGCGIIQYEHVDPEYKDAETHDANCIVTLCPTCHASVTSRFWSKATVKKYAENPACKNQGYLKHVFDFYSEKHPVVRFGGVSLKNCPIPLEIFSAPIIQIKPPEAEGAPFRLSGTFCDRDGAPTLKIIDNEWIAYTDSWDVEVGAAGITIRNGPGNIVLKISVLPPDTLLVDRLKMRFGFVDIEATSEKLVINTNTFTGCIIDGCSVGMSLYPLSTEFIDPNINRITAILRQRQQA